MIVEANADSYAITHVLGIIYLKGECMECT